MSNDGSALNAAFSAAFGRHPAGVWQAPGRVNLIGEHTDYNGGFVLPFAIDRRTSVAVALREDSQIRLQSTFAETAPVQSTVQEAGDAQGWSAYVLGVVWALGEAGVDVPGFDLLVDSTVPTGAGLSSSAALESAVALALTELIPAALSRKELVLISQRAENDVVGAPTGILDQSASLLAETGQAVFLDCRSQDHELVPLDLPAAGLEMLVIDTKVSHAHADGGYRARRESCERGAQITGVHQLRDLSPDDLQRAAELLDEETFRRVRHIITENKRVLRTVDSLRAQGPTSIGALLSESHRSMRDDFEISCRELDLAVQIAEQEGALGARMTGGGFGGSAIALIETGRSESAQQALLGGFAQAGMRTPEIFTVLPAAGARRVE